MIGRHEFEFIFNAEARLIEDCVKRGATEYYARYADQLHIHSALARAILIRDHVVWNIKEAFPNDCELIRKRLFVLRLQHGEVRVRFKKLNSHLLASNHPTRLALGFVGQQLNFDGMAPSTNLTAGYRWGEGLELQVWITCPAGLFSNAWEWLVSTTAEPPTSVSRDTPDLLRPPITPRAEERFQEHVSATQHGA